MRLPHGGINPFADDSSVWDFLDLDGVPTVQVGSTAPAPPALELAPTRSAVEVGGALLDANTGPAASGQLASSAFEPLSSLAFLQNPISVPGGQGTSSAIGPNGAS